MSYLPQFDAKAPGLEIRTAQLSSPSGRRTVQLPNILKASDFQPDGSRVRYRLTVNLTERPSRPLAIYASKIALSGSLYLNGAYVGACAPRRLEDARCLHQSVTFVAPAPMWRAGANTLEFEVFASSRQANGLSIIRIARTEEISRAFGWKHWVQYDLLIGLAWLSAAIGLLCLGVGLALRQAPGYVWFGLTSFTHALASVNEFTVAPPLDAATYSTFIFSSRLISVPMLVLAVLAIFGRSRTWITRTCLIFIIAAPFVIWLSDNSRAVVGWLYLPWLIATPLMIVWTLRWSFMTRRRLHLAISGLLAALFAGGALDWLKTVSDVNFETSHLLPYMYGATLLVMGAALIRVLASTLRESITQTIALEKQISERLAYEVTRNIPIGTFSLTLPAGATTPVFSFASERYLELTGLKDGPPLNDLEQLLTIIDPADREQWASIHEEAIAQKSPISAHARISVGTELRWIAVEAKPRRSVAGSTIWDGVLVDETERVLASKAAERDRAALQTNLLEQSRLKEREELLRDMHDGFGSQLASVRMMAEKGAVSPRQVSKLLEEVSADLHLVVDTLGHADVTLADALADLRYRLGPRVAHTSTTLKWNIALEQVPLLNPRSVLQLLRIVQEALNNALKHSGGCCQSDANSSPLGTFRPKRSGLYAARFCHSARAAERRALNVSLSMRWRSELKWL